MPLNLARFLSDPRLYHLLLYCTSATSKAKWWNFELLAELLVWYPKLRSLGEYTEQAT